MNSNVVTRPKKRKITRTFVSLCLIIVLISVLFLGCGENTQIVGQWHMTKVLVGDREYDAATFLDPSDQTDGTFLIQFYGDNTLIATGSLDTIKGASDGIWKEEKENIYTITIDNQEREVKMVGDLLFMDIEIEDATMVIVFERE